MEFVCTIRSLLLNCACGNVLSLFQVVPDEEIDEVILLPDGPTDEDLHHRSKRKINSDVALLWPDGVVYYSFDNTLCKTYLRISFMETPNT